ncbi:hypothetical protein [Streptomyces sp. LARHCF252]
MIASLMPGARAVLRRIVEMGGTATYDEAQQHFADHPTAPIPRAKIGGSLTSVKAVQRRVGPAGADHLLQRDERARLYRIERVLVERLIRAVALADSRPDLMRRDPDGQEPSPPDQGPTALRSGTATTPVSPWTGRRVSRGDSVAWAWWSPGAMVGFSGSFGSWVG